MSGIKLSPSFYLRDDVTGIARELLGKMLYTCVDGQLTGGMIVETEAYCGPEDRGSHAWNNRRTARNETMYAEGGVVYMYICYGIHDMLNVVTGSADSSHAILIRAMQPLTGLEIMRSRRDIYDDDVRLCKGPGALAKALGLSKLHNTISLQGNDVWIEDAPAVQEGSIVPSARIGMNFDGPYKTVPWRFFLRESRYVSGRKS